MKINAKSCEGFLLNIPFFVYLRNRIKVPLRRIMLPNMKLSDFTLDIGSGGTPNPRADVCVDFIEGNLERIEALKIDRPFVWASCEKLPFKSKCFSYSIMSHLLEHLDNPEKCLDEVQRVAESGYIETPNAFFEYIIPHTYHVSRASYNEQDDTLYIHFKDSWDETIDKNKYPDVHRDMKKAFASVELYDWNLLLSRYYWKDKIKYKVIGSNTCKKPDELLVDNVQKRSFINALIIKLVYFVFKRRKKINLEALLVCPECKGELSFSDNEASCNACSNTYKKIKGIWDFRI